MKKHSALLLILAAVLCLGLLSTGVCASDPVYVGETEVSDGSYYVMDNNTGELTKTGASVNNFNAKYNPATKTLTLKDFQYSGPGHVFEMAKYSFCYAGIYYYDYIDIKVIDFCGIELTGCEYADGGIFGIFGGEVMLEGYSGKGSEYFVINLEDTKSYTGIDSDGLSLNNINLSINAGTAKSCGTLIDCDKLNAYDSVINLWGGAAGEDICGIYSDGDATLTKSTLDLVTGPGTDGAKGIDAVNFYSTDSTVSVVAGDCSNGHIDGIYCYNDMIVDGGSVYVESGKVSGGFLSQAVFVQNDVSLSNCKGTFLSADSGGSSGAVYANMNINIENCDIRACAGKAKWASNALETVYRNIVIKDSTVFARTDAAEKSVAISYGTANMNPEIVLRNSDVIAYAKAGTEKQRAYLNAPKCEYTGGYSVIAGSDCSKAAQIDNAALSSAIDSNPFIWITDKKNTVSKFKDVKAGSWYGLPVQWAVAHGITAGTGDGTTFSPTLVCDRAQMVTFLWKLSGCPEPWSSVDDTDFTDVQNGKYYTKAVLWAYDKGITKGTSATTFEPYKQVSRAEVVMFLWNYCRQPKPQGTVNPFKDLTANWYKDAVLWAYENGITSGKTATVFAPQDPCTRAEIVSFLFRFDMIR